MIIIQLDRLHFYFISEPFMIISLQFMDYIEITGFFLHFYWVTVLTGALTLFHLYIVQGTGEHFYCWCLLSNLQILIDFPIILRHFLQNILISSLDLDSCVQFIVGNISKVFILFIFFPRRQKVIYMTRKKFWKCCL